MSIDVRNEIQVAPQQIVKFGEKPEIPKTQEQKVDEEKSNAAKWMIGLTATAAIVIGGLWAAKHGHLGEGAQKAVKKLFGEASETASNTKKTSDTKAPDKVDTSDDTPVLSAITHKNIRKYIKNPDIKFEDLIKELENAKIAFRKSVNVTEGKLPNIIVDSDAAKYSFRFMPDGTLSSIARRISDVEGTTYHFANGRLSSIGRKIPTINAAKKTFVLEHVQEFGEKGQLVKQKLKADIDPLIKIDLESIEGLPNSFRSGAVSEFLGHFKTNYEKLPATLKKAKFYPQVTGVDVDYKTAQYLTPRATKYVNAKFAEIPKDVPTEELVRYFIGLDNKLYQQTVDDINLMRRISQRTKTGLSEYNSSSAATPKQIFDRQYEQRVSKTDIAQKLVDYISFTREKAEVFSKLLSEDMGSVDNVSFEQILEAYRMYSSKFRAFKIDKPELMTSAVKSIKECSVDDFLNILREVSPERYGKLEPEKINKDNLLKEIRIITGRPTIDENTKLFDILQDLK